jgi:MIP family channel proteins
MSQQMYATRRELLAEFLGTCVLILFGVGVVAQVVLSRNTAGSYLSINLVWGLGVTMACYVAGGVSGAHLNPAVTIALAVHRGFPWRKVVPYSLAQLAGAFVASAVVYATYFEALAQFDGGVRQVAGAQGTAGIWATYPQPFLSTLPGGFIDQVVGTAIRTAILLAVIFALTDQRNVPPVAGLGPLIVGLLVVAIGAAFGFNSGYAINPARDFGPRLFTAFAGWGIEVFRAGNGWWWVPVIAPPVGAVLGGWVYDVCVGRHFPATVVTGEAGEPGRPSKEHSM